MKSVKILLPFAVVWGGLSFAFAQTWTNTAAPTNGWMQVAISADGSKLAAAIVLDTSQTDGEIYTSTNYGFSWVSNSAPLSQWTSIASSANGSVLVACSGNDQNGDIYVITNDGAVWQQSTNAPAKQWTSIAVSADGIQIIASSFGGDVFTSTNSGYTWIDHGLAEGLPSLIGWAFVGSSSNGLTLLLAGYGGGIAVSTNGGVYWTQTQAPNEDWEGIASSADGIRLAAVARTTSGGAGPIYTSTNTGSTWTSNTVPNQLWSSIASSADGSRLIAAGGGTQPSVIYVSTNAGASWALDSGAPTAPHTGWENVASSADGEMLAAVRGPGITGMGIILGTSPLYVSQTTPSPLINVMLSNNTIALSWIVPSTNFVLQQSTDLQNWSDVTNQPCLNFTNLNDEVSLPMTNSIGFYRLGTQ